MTFKQLKSIIINNLSDDLLSPKWLNKKKSEVNCHPTFGHCYVATEAAYHILGGKRKGWKPYCLSYGNSETHWFLKNSSGYIFDVTAEQYNGKFIDYAKARGNGFLTKQPSKRAKKLILKIKRR